MKRKVVILLLIVFVFTGCSHLTLARGIRESAHYHFGEKLVFEVSATSKLKEALLFYRISDYSPWDVQLIEGDGHQMDGGVSWWYRQATIDKTEAEVIILLVPGTIAPAAEVKYFWKLEDGQGNIRQTEEKSFRHLDPWLTWQEHKHQDVALFWYEEDEEFAETILAQVDQSFGKINGRLGLNQNEPIKVVAYLDRYDMARATSSACAMSCLGQAWKNTLVFHFHSDSTLLSQILTHELAHLLVHQNYQLFREGLPFWLQEGLATYADGGDWEQWVTNSPFSLFGGLEAYGWAYSHITFLIEEHGGKETLHQLLTAIAEGQTVDEALLATYGFDQEGMEEVWLDWLALREATREPLLDVSRSMDGGN